MFKKLFLFLCFICTLFMQINYGNAIGIDEINNDNIDTFITDREKAISEIYNKGKDFFSYDNLNNCIGDVNANAISYRKYIRGDNGYRKLSNENKDKLGELVLKEATLRSYCRQNLSIMTGVNDGSGFSSNGMLRGMCFFLSILRGNYAKTIAALFVIGLGFLMLFGNLKFTSYMFFVIALALTFGADQVANVISGNKFSCNYINTSYKTAAEIKCPTGSYYKNGRCAFTSCSNLANTYLDTNFSSTSTSVKNGEKVYKECGVGKYGYVEYICKDGELDYNLDTCYTPGNYCTARTLPIMSGANFNLSGITVEIGTIVESACANSYLGTAKIICQKDKTWKVESTCKVDTSKYCNTSDIYANLGGVNGINAKHIKLNISKVKQGQAINPGKTDSDIGISCDVGYEGNVSLLCGANKKWFIDNTCTIIKCPTEYGLDNGKYNITNNTYKSKITGVCNTGYIGTPEAICGLDGNWSTLSGSCTLDKEFCSTLSAENGVVDNKRTLDSYATLRCNNGYELSGKGALLCKKDKTWDGEFGKCELSLNYCDKVDFISGVGKIEYIDGNRALGSKMKITCKDGYMLKGNDVLKCQSDKTWSLTSGTCELISCSNLALVENVEEWYGNIATKGQEIQGVCKKGYIGKPKAICNGNGQWDIHNDCVIDMHYCGALSVVDGDVKYSNEQAAGSKATLTCNTGYELSGNSSVSCDADKDGLWSDKIGNCQKVRCPTSLALNDGKYTITNDNNKFGDKVVGICDLGYVGEPIAICNANKTWSTTGLCKLVECNGLDKVNPNSKYDGITTTKYGVPVKGICKIGYKGSPVANCQEDGTWSVENDCQLDTEFCNEIKAVRGAYIAYKGNGRALGSKAILTCGTGFQLVGNNISTCSESGKWEAEIGTCQLITNFCKQFNKINGGTIKYTESQAFNSTASLKCNIGYGLKGDGEAICMSNREWDNELGICEPEKNWCSLIKEIANGVISYSHSNDRDSVATLKCNTGYTINGNATTSCGENKKWSKTLGTCKLIEKYCPTLKTINNGTITYLDVAKLAYNSSVELQCNTGYSLSGISSAKCQANKKWSELGTCEIIHCPITTLTVENGTYDEITTENNAYSKTINGTCKTGYIGNPKATCDKNGNWVLSGSCDIINCENLTIDSDSTNWNAIKTSYGKSIYGTCKVGYEGEPRVVCGVDMTSGSPVGKWNIVKQCNKIMKFCSILGDEHGTYKYSEEQALNSKATLTCNTGYELINLGTTVCQTDRTWSNSIKCKIKVCENLTKQGHVGSWAATKANWNTTVNGTCATGYRGLPTAKCLDNKTWEIKDNCILKTCSNPIKQGHIISWDKTKININETITGKCETGYKGAPTAKCIDQDKWEYNNNCQIMTCNDPELIGKVKSWDKTSTNYGTPIYGICLDGYEGKPEANCNAKEQWEIVDNCKEKVCSNVNEQAKVEKQEGIASWKEETTIYGKEITGVCAKGYTGTVTATCKADQTWDIKNNCKKIKDYCPKITRSDIVTYTDDQTIGSVAKLTCSGNYGTFVGEKEVKCITDDTKKDDDKGKWDKELGDCGVVIQFYSPRNGAAKEKAIKKGSKFICAKSTFDTNTDTSDLDPNVKKLCRIKGSKQYFGHEGVSYTLNDDLLSQKDTACHIAYVKEDLSDENDKIDNKIKSAFLSDYTKAGGETKLYNDSVVYSSDNNGGLRQNGGKYTIKCSGNVIGKPEIICQNGKWTWSPDENTGNYCYAGGCDISDLPVAGRHIINSRYTFGSNGYSSNQTSIKNNGVVEATCESGYVSNQDTKDPKVLKAKCVNGDFERTIDDVKYGDECVPGCVYGDTSMGWTDKMMTNTVDGDYQEHDVPGWGLPSIGKYAVRLLIDETTSLPRTALLYKNCASGYSVDNSSQSYVISYPMVQCDAGGKWGQHGGYKVGCIRPSVDCGTGTLTGDVTNGYCTYNYTGEMQTFKSTGIKQVFLKVCGAQGGGKYGGPGGYSYGLLYLDSNTNELYVYVGGQGQEPASKLNEKIDSEQIGAGGYNGGGDCYRLTYNCGGGGGATDIRKDGTSDSNRIIVAGGGGGSSEDYDGGCGGGGDKSGGSGHNCTITKVGGIHGSGGTLNEPGVGGTPTGTTLWCGAFGNDGNGSKGGDSNKPSVTCKPAGAGGGGYYGGGSGSVSRYSGAGGGGSGYIGGVSNGGGVSGAKEGNGLARICWGSYASESACPGI